MIARPGRILALAGLLGVAATQLFWGAMPGVSVLLFAALAFGAMLLAARSQSPPSRPPPRVAALVVPLALAALGPALRAEPMTVALNVLLTLALLVLLALSWPTQEWYLLGLRQWLRRGLRLGGDLAVAAPVLALQAGRERERSGGEALQPMLPALRGALLAAPILVVFAVLLASADTVFAAGLEDLFGRLPALTLPDVSGRIVFAAVVAYLAAGLLRTLLRRPAEAERAGTGLRRLGITEAAIVLGSVDALFAVFVAIQVRYLFGGAAPVLDGELTYAEYARRGFGELVAVATLTVLLLLALSAVTRREEAGHQRLFRWLSAGLVALVLVILASAFQRLLLYEDAFGFTRARTYGHVFMVWLGVLLVALLVLEATRRTAALPATIAAAAVGFVLSLTLLGVDGFVARRNVARAVDGHTFDPYYLTRLSVDAIPPLVALAPDLPEPLRADVLTAVSCIAQDDGITQDRRWQSATLARARARAALDDLTALPGCT